MIQGTNLPLSFNTPTEQIKHWERHNKQVIASPLLDNFYRVPLNNDIGVIEVDNRDPNAWQELIAVRSGSYVHYAVV